MDFLIVISDDADLTSYESCNDDEEIQNKLNIKLPKYDIMSHA